MSRLPIATPGKIIAVGRNYRAHVAEEDATLPTEPLLFAKLPSAVIPDGAAITWSASLTSQVDYTRPLGERTKLETGYKGTLRWIERDFDVPEDEVGTGEWVPGDLSNALELDEFEIQAGERRLQGLPVTGPVGRAVDREVDQVGGAGGCCGRRRRGGPAGPGCRRR